MAGFWLNLFGSGELRFLPASLDNDSPANFEHDRSQGSLALIMMSDARTNVTGGKRSGRRGKGLGGAHGFNQDCHDCRE